MSRIKTAKCGDLVFDALTHGGDMPWQGISDWTAKNRGHRLSRDQINRGVSYVKDTLAFAHKEPIIFDFSEGVYRLGADKDVVEDYYRMRSGTARKQLKRLLSGTVLPQVEKMGETPELRYVTRSIRRVVEDLEDLSA